MEAAAVAGSAAPDVVGGDVDSPPAVRARGRAAHRHGEEPEAAADHRGVGSWIVECVHSAGQEGLEAPGEGPVASVVLCEFGVDVSLAGSSLCYRR